MIVLSRENQCFFQDACFCFQKSLVSMGFRNRPANTIVPIRDWTQAIYIAMILVEGKAANTIVPIRDWTPEEFLPLRQPFPSANTIVPIRDWTQISLFNRKNRVILQIPLFPLGIGHLLSCLFCFTVVAPANTIVPIRDWTLPRGWQQYIYKPCKYHCSH